VSRTGPALQGRSGPHGAAELLRTLLDAKEVGTLATAGPRGLVTTLIDGGETIARAEHGAPPGSDVADVAFAFHDHALPSGARHGVPELPSRFQGATDPHLRAIPQLPARFACSAHLAHLPAWLATLEAEAADGLLTLDEDGDAAVALLAEGRIRAAIGERRPRSGAAADDAPLPVHNGDALRLLLRHGGATPGGTDATTDPPDAPTLQFAPLPPSWRGAFAGLLLGREGDAPHGVRLTAREATLLEGGVPILRVGGGGSAAARFQAHPNPTALPPLPLPDDPPDLETRRYHLTLRGRDALDPMTDLAMSFESDYGPSGKELLRTLQRGLDVGGCADALGVGLDQLAPWLRRLEADGLIRTER
jgi:hypothetical protein